MSPCLQFDGELKELNVIGDLVHLGLSDSVESWIKGCAAIGLEVCVSEERLIAYHTSDQLKKKRNEEGGNWKKCTYFIASTFNCNLSMKE